MRLMMRVTMPLTIALCALAVAAATSSARAETPRGQTKMSDGDAQFAAALHGALRGKSGNLFYSPASVRIAMAMAAAGARGDTAAQMQKALALPAGDAAHAAIGKQLADWAAMAKPPLPSTAASDPEMQKIQEQELDHRRVVLRVVNRLWAQAGKKFRDAFVALLRDQYRAPLGTVDFHHDAARVAINKWVADATEQKIKQLIVNPIPPDTK